MDAAVALACPWRFRIGSLPSFALGGETVFAIGDCAWLRCRVARVLGRHRRLASEASGNGGSLYLGEMINRGPDSVGVLEQCGCGRGSFMASTCRPPDGQP